MKLKKTILTSLLATSFLIGGSAQAQDPNQACNQANSDLMAALALYGGDSYNVTNNVGYTITIIVPITGFGAMMIQDAQNQVTLYCSNATIGVGGK